MTDKTDATESRGSYEVRADNALLDLLLEKNPSNAPRRADGARDYSSFCVDVLAAVKEVRKRHPEINDAECVGLIIAMHAATLAHSVIESSGGDEERAGGITMVYAQALGEDFINVAHQLFHETFPGAIAGVGHA